MLGKHQAREAGLPAARRHGTDRCWWLLQKWHSDPWAGTHQGCTVSGRDVFIMRGVSPRAFLRELVPECLALRRVEGDSAVMLLPCPLLGALLSSSKVAHRI